MKTEIYLQETEHIADSLGFYDLSSIPSLGAKIRVANKEGHFEDCEVIDMIWDVRVSSEPKVELIVKRHEV